MERIGVPMAKKRMPSKSVKAGKAVLRAIRTHKDMAKGRVWKALHQAEGQLSVALGMVTYKKKSPRKGKKKS
jgi:hypothetical protein